MRELRSDEPLTLGTLLRTMNRPSLRRLVMSLTVELPDEVANALADEAARLGMSVPDYAVRLLSSARSSAVKLQNGADLVSFWRAEGLIGTRTDIDDSQVEARRLREQAQRRGA